jgi:hypothetical protein
LIYIYIYIYIHSLTSLPHVSVLSKAFGRKWEGVTGDWRRLREEELTKHYSGDQIGETDWRDMWHVWCIQGYGVESLGRRSQLEVVGVDRRIIVEWREKFWGSFERGNEPLGTIRCGKLLDWLRKC